MDSRCNAQSPALVHSRPSRTPAVQNCESWLKCDDACRWHQTKYGPRNGNPHPHQHPHQHQYQHQHWALAGTRKLTISYPVLRNLNLFLGFSTKVKWNPSSLNKMSVCLSVSQSIIAQTLNMIQTSDSHVIYIDFTQNNKYTIMNQI